VVATFVAAAFRGLIILFLGGTKSALYPFNKARARFLARPGFPIL
jgi:hypothetical protein